MEAVMATNGMFNAIITKVTLTFVFLLAACGGGDSGNQAVAPESGSELSSSYDYDNGAFTTSSSFGFVNPQSSSSVPFFYGSSSSFLISFSSSSSRQVYSKSSSSFVKSSSSSKKIQSSSSVKKKSSSSSVPYSSMTDSRDGQTYRIVNIGKQTWMAENLNYKIEGSYCYLGKNEYCDKYGRFYDRGPALIACPSGWHLPTTTEWFTLNSYIGGESGKKLKSKNGWDKNVKALDSYGFSALPAGYAVSDLKGYTCEGEQSRFWNYDENSIFSYFEIDSSVDATVWQMKSDEHTYAYSIRCLKGKATYILPSSSSKVSASSSSQQISSSSQIVVTKGTMKDSRDGQTYKTITIGDQTWMAENLNFLDPNKRSFCYCSFHGSAGECREGDKCGEGDLWYLLPSYCPHDKSSNCSKYGRLYLWSTAMDSAGVYSTNGLGCGYNGLCEPKYPVRGICPAGWHLPTKEEWQHLYALVNEYYNYGESYNYGVKLRVLRSANDWSDCEDDDVTKQNYKDFGFSILPAGYGWFGGSTIQRVGDPSAVDTSGLLLGGLGYDYNHYRWVEKFNEARFWTSTFVSRYSARFIFIRCRSVSYDDSSENVNLSWYSVRCVKDSAE